MPTYSRLAGLVISVVLAASTAGCSNSPTKGGMPWWSQGPGNADEVLSGAASENTATAVKPEPAARPAPEVRTTPADNTAAPAAGPARVAPNASRFASSTAAAAPRLTRAPQFARYGDLLFMSGQIADTSMDAAGNMTSVADETRDVMQKIQAILESQHLTMANVVNTTIFLTDIQDLVEVESVFDSYFRGARPANSVVAVSELPANARVQIAAVAGR